MATLIQTRGGPAFLTDEPIEAVKAAVDRGEVLTVWWFAVHGQRYRETIWFNPEEIAWIRSESDDG